MKNYIYIIIAALGLLLTTTSCSDVGEIERTLDVDAPSVLLSKDAQSTTVAVTVDPGVNFTATWDGESWGSVIANVKEGTVTISTSENTTLEERKAVVIVALDGGVRNRMINIRQTGEEHILGVFPDEIAFDFMGGDFTADVVSNVKWSISGAAEWVDIKEYVASGKIVIKVGENTKPYPRSSTITVTAGNTSKEIGVLQDAGVLTMIPYLDLVNANYIALIEFEEARYSIMVGKPYNMRSSPIEAMTRSNLMPSLLYWLNPMTKKVEYVAMKLDLKYMPDFFRKGETQGQGHDFMLANNFEYLFAVGSTDLYWMDMGEGAPLHYLIHLSASDDYVRYEAMATKPDPQDMPTFDALPYKPEAIAWGSHKDDAKVWEITNDAEIDIDEDYILSFDMQVTDKLYRIREYTYTTPDDNLRMVSLVFKELEITRMYLLAPTGYMLNPRFAKLLADEGFVHLRDDIDNYPVFKNTAKELEVKAYMVKIGGVGESHATLTYLHVPTVAPSGASKFGAPPAPYKVVELPTKINRSR